MEENIQTENNFLDKGNKKNAFKKIIFLMITFLGFLILATYFIFFRIPNDFPSGKIINIKEGSSLRTFSKVLSDEGVISSRQVFEAFVIILGDEKHLIPGDYLFKEKLYVFEVAKRVLNGEKGLAPIKLTIPEGFTNLDIALLAESKFSNFDKARFLSNAKEGYLFPDTYFFLTTDSDKEILEKLSNTFEQKMKIYEQDVLKSGKNFHDILVMASIVEREAKGDDDRAEISGILWKRIAIGMPLQADAAPITYKEKGLPEEAISNPGLASILASIYPKNSPYLYYIHDKDGNIYFARTFAEHRKNIEKYLK